MAEERTQELLDRASEHYNRGEYDEAIARWREVLDLDPASTKAREGIRMARLLVTGWQDEKAGEEKAAAVALDPDVRARLDAGMERVRTLIGEGRLDEAIEGCALLEQIAPGLEEIRELRAEVRGTAGTPAPEQTDDLEGHLQRAREALAQERHAEAAAAAREALRVDPSNMEACGILSMAGGDEEEGPVRIGDEAMADFDFEEGSIPLEDESEPAGDDRIAALLKEGQAAFDQGRLQDAIGTWSRVLAIDETNTEATARIDLARAALDEHDRGVDDLLYRARDAESSGRLEEARDLLGEILTHSPGHAEAATLLEELEARLAGGFNDTIRIDAQAAREVAVQKEAVRPSPEEMAFQGGSVPLVREEVLPPSVHPPRESARELDTAVPVARPVSAGGGRRLILAAIGTLVFIATGAGAYFYFGQANGSIPEAHATPTVPAPPAPAGPAGPSEAAPSDTAPGGATAPLRVVPGGAQPAGPVPAGPAAPPAPVTAQDLIREAQGYAAEERWAEAALAFRQAIDLDPLGFNAQTELDLVIRELEKQAKFEQEMEQVSRYFKEEDYGSALHKLYRLQLDHPRMKIFDTYIRNAWFNWGVILMRSGAVDEAIEKFEEVLSIPPRDQEAARAREVAERYRSRTRDAAFDAFAEALPMRTLDKR